jgi:hypothetical protein
MEKRVTGEIKPRRLNDAELEDDLRLKLISEVQQRPCLWLLTHIDYLNKVKKQKAKDEIVSAFGNKYPEEFLFRCWKNLQDSWRRIYKKQHAQRNANGEIPDDYPPWPFYKAMKFMEMAGGRRRDGTKYSQPAVAEVKQEKPATSEAPKRRVPHKRPVRRYTQGMADDQYTEVVYQAIPASKSSGEFSGSDSGGGQQLEYHIAEPFVDPTRYDEFSHIGHQVAVILREMNRLNQVFTCHKVCELQNWLYRQKEALLTGNENIEE